MLRLALFLVFAILAARGFWRLVDGIIEGVTGPRQSGRAPQQGVSMARDPVCGTFVLPERAVTLVDGRSRLFFCSNACRDRYRARPSTRSASSRSTVSDVEPSSGSGRPESVEGRTA